MDLFCGAGGLTRGLLNAGINVVAGYDTDPACRFPYEHNNSPARFVLGSVASLSQLDLRKSYPAGTWRVLVGCAPCQPFSTYTQGYSVDSDERWSLLSHFGRLLAATKPDVVSMENVPGLSRHNVFQEFITGLRSQGYSVWFGKVYCPHFGVPQRRTRLVVLASRLGPIGLVPRTHSRSRFRTVQQTIGQLPLLEAGKIDPNDPLHRAAGLSSKNVRRMQASLPGGTWRDWPDGLLAKCHEENSGRTYSGVYGRMAWDQPSPTITTQFFGYGSGRFGHPEQDRGLSLREGALIQGFARTYKFAEDSSPLHFKTIGRLIGNAVPVQLGAAVGRSIVRHLAQYE